MTLPGFFKAWYRLHTISRHQGLIEAKSQVCISTVSGEYDTWKIVCKAKNDKRTYYYSPELGAMAAMNRKHYKDKTRNRTLEWVRAE